MHPHAPRCDHEGCSEWGTYGFTAPYGHPKPKRPLWACFMHRDWAESRWRAKYHTGSDRPRCQDMQQKSRGGGGVSAPASDPRQQTLI